MVVRVCVALLLGNQMTVTIQTWKMTNYYLLLKVNVKPLIQTQKLTVTMNTNSNTVFILVIFVQYLVLLSSHMIAYCTYPGRVYDTFI